MFFKRLKGIKDLLWAAAIGLALMSLFIGLIAASFTSYHGDKERPAIDLLSEKEEKAALKAEKSGSSKALTVPVPDETLHSLAETEDAGKNYFRNVTILCDSSFAALNSSKLSKAAVWVGETGQLPMNDVENWSVQISRNTCKSLSDAVKSAKPKILVLALGSDGSAEMKKSRFVAAYEGVISSISEASPETVIVCLPSCSVTPAYRAEDGWDKEMIGKINSRIKTACTNTGVYFCDVREVLCSDGYLKDDYAADSGRAINSDGAAEVLTFLRTHSVYEQ